MKTKPVAPEKLTQGCAQLGIDLSITQSQQLWQHLGLLMKWNRGMNLTAIRNMDDMVTHHLLDSLSIARFVRGQSLLDIGSGGGFPGVPLAIVHPQWAVTLLDSRDKRSQFLRHVCAVLGLTNVTVVATRVEKYQTVERFDTLTTRAFASVADTWALTSALHQRGSRFLMMKGRLPKQELAQAKVALRAQVNVEKLKVPFLSAERHLLIVEL